MLAPLPLILERPLHYPAESLEGSFVRFRDRLLQEVERVLREGAPLLILFPAGPAEVARAPQRVGALLNVRNHLQRGLFDRVLDLLRSLVRACQTRLDDASQRRGRSRVTKLDRLVDAVRHDQLLNLGHEVASCYVN